MGGHLGTPMDKNAFLGLQCRMTCPACHEQMRSIELDNQEILHCANCGTSFFEDNGINRIDILKARDLAKERYNNNVVMPQKPICPRDETELKLVSGTEAVPATVRLYMCHTCQGVLASANDLENFKKAQLAKLDYFKSWNMPLGSLRGVLAMGLLFLLSGTIYWTYNTVSKEATIRSEAEGLINNVDVSYNGRYMFVAFKTKTAVRASLVIDNRTTNKVTIVPISTESKTLHTITIARPSTNETVLYRVRLEDRDGRVVDTKEIELN